MDDYSVVDISNWTTHEYLNTKGSREKWIVDDSYGYRHFFKKSIDRFAHEFWSEIIAYHLGQMLGFPVLQYKAAILQHNIGCLCRSLIRPGEDLVEGLQFIQAYIPWFDPSNKLNHDVYSFQLIEKALEQVGLTVAMKEIIQTIVFDAAIGNQDRHQENWAFKIVSKRKISEGPISAFINRLKIGNKGYASTKAGVLEYKAYMDLTFDTYTSFTEIYDSGSSLGRELLPDKIDSMLTNKQQLLKYIQKGKAEIRWKNQRLTHFELVNKLYKESGYAWVDDYINQIGQLYNEERFAAIIQAVDQQVPDSFAEHKIPTRRKELIVQMTSARVKELTNIL